MKQSRCAIAQMCLCCVLGAGACDDRRSETANPAGATVPQSAESGEQFALNRPPLSQSPSIAVLDVAVQGGSWRSPLAPVQESIIQAAAGVPEIRLVERAQLQRALDELTLSSAGDSLKLGSMVGAEVLIRSVLRAADATLTLEYIDLRHADVVQSRELKLPNRRVDAALLEQISLHLPGDIRVTCERIRARESRILVAPVFFRNSSPIDRLNYLNRQLTDALVRASNDQVSVLSLAQLDEAAAEADLALLGMTDVDPDLWQNLADVYVWGSYREVSPAAANGMATLADDVPVEMSVTLWNGAGETAEMTRKTTIGGLRRELGELAQEICQRAASMKPRTLQAAARRELVQMLYRTGAGQQSDYAAQCLELALFIAPHELEVIRSRIGLLEREKNRSLPHRMKTLRWAQRMYARHPEYMTSARQYVQTLREGLLAAKPAGDAVLSEEQRDAMRAILQAVIAHAQASRSQQHKPGYEPDYLSLVRVMSELPDELLEQSAQGILAVWPLARPSYMKSVARSEQPVTELQYGMEAKLHGTLSAAGKGELIRQMLWMDPEGATAAGELALPQGKPREVLAKLSATWPPGVQIAREPTPRSLTSYDSQWRRPPEEMPWVDAPAAYYPLAGPGRMHGREGGPVILAEDRGIIWAAAAASHLPSLTRFDPATRLREDLTAALSINSPITCLVAHAGAVWVGTKGDGLRRVDAVTMAVTSFGTAEGLRSSSVAGIAAYGDRLFVSGGGPLVSVLDLSKRTFSDEEFPGGVGKQTSPGKLCSRGEWALRESPDALVNLRDGRVVPLSDVIRDAKLAAPASVDTAALDDGRCWLIAGGHLVAYELATGTVQQWKLPLDHEYMIAPAGNLVMLLSTALSVPPAQGMMHTSTVPDLFQRTYATTLDVSTGQWLGKSVYRGDLRPAAFSGTGLWLGGSGAAVRVNLAALQPTSVPAAYLPAADDAATSLCRAAYAGDLPAVLQLLESGAGANATVGEMTPLLAAVAADRPEICALLLKHGASRAGPRSESAYRVAARNGSARAFAAVSAGDEATIPVGEARSALLPFAAGAGSLSMVRQLIQPDARIAAMGPDPLTGEYHSGITLAVRSSHDEIVAAMLSANGVEPADVDGALFEISVMQDGSTAREVMRHAVRVLGAERFRDTILADTNLLRRVYGSGIEVDVLGRETRILSYALELGFEETARKLIDAGADPNAVHPGEFGDAPLVVACGRSTAAMIEELIKRGARWETRVGEKRVLDKAFVRAALARRLELAADLLERGADVNTPTNSGATALHEVAEHAPTVALMLAWGADPQARDAQGRTAADKTRNDAARALLQAQSPGAGKPAPWLAAYCLAEAARKGELAAAREALDSGAGAKVIDTGGWPVLVLAARSANPDLVTLLLQRGADVNKPGPGGWTALMQAARRGDAAMVRALLEAGADPSAANRDHLTASDIALKHGHRQLQSLLSEP